MHEPFGAAEAFAKANPDIVKSYRVHPGHAVEGKVKVEIRSSKAVAAQA